MAGSGPTATHRTADGEMGDKNKYTSVEMDEMHVLDETQVLDDNDEALWFSKDSKYSQGASKGFEDIFGDHRAVPPAAPELSHVDAEAINSLYEAIRIIALKLLDNNKHASGGEPSSETQRDNRQRETDFIPDRIAKHGDREKRGDDDDDDDGDGIPNAREVPMDPNASETSEEYSPQVLDDEYIEKAKETFTEEPAKYIKRLITAIEQNDVHRVATALAGIKTSGTKLRDVDMKFGKIRKKESGLRYSILHMALMKEKPDIVQMLLREYGEDLYDIECKFQGGDKFWPIDIMVLRCDLVSLSHFIKAPNIPSERLQNILNRKIEIKKKGSLILAWLVWGFDEHNTEFEELKNKVKELVSKGLKLDNKDDEGNTFLHLLVRQATEPNILSRNLMSKDQSNQIKPNHSREYFRYVLTEVVYDAVDSSEMNERFKGKTPEAIRYLLSLKNNDGLTPVSYAAKVESYLYPDIVKWKNITWYPYVMMSIRFGSAGLYDINNMMSFETTGKYLHGSVMHVLSHMVPNLEKKVDTEHPLNIEPMKTIIMLKWKYYSSFYWMWAFLHLVHMITFTYCGLYLDNKKTTPSNSTRFNSTNDNNLTVARLTANNFSGRDVYYALFLILPLFYLIMEFVDLYVSLSAYDSMRSYISWVTSYAGSCNLIYRLLLDCFSFLTIVWFILNMIQFEHLDIILSLVLLLGWCFMLFFLRCATFPPMTGHFSIMVHEILLRDLIPFAIVSVVFLCAFSTAMHAIILKSDDEGTKPYIGHLEFTAFEMLKFFIAMDDTQGYKPTRTPHVAKIFLCLFGFLSAVLLINVLIAAMNKTYNMIKETNIDLIAQQKLAIILLLERRVPVYMRNKSEIPNFTKKYFMRKQDGSLIPLKNEKSFRESPNLHRDVLLNSNLSED